MNNFALFGHYFDFCLILLFSWSIKAHIHIFLLLSPLQLRAAPKWQQLDSFQSADADLRFQTIDHQIVLTLAIARVVTKFETVRLL